MEQYEKIKGYRQLSDDEIAMMNDGKELAERCGDYVNKLESMDLVDKRWVGIGRTNLQQGFMALIRSIAKPSTF